MKFISWNVNGLRACMKKGFMDFFIEQEADIFCLQETKLQEGQIELDLNGYTQYWDSAVKKGYAGTAVFTKHPPLSVFRGMGIADHDREGRMITLEYETFFLINVYVPNAQRGLARLAYRKQWQDDFKTYIQQLKQKKPVIICGDMNVAHQEIDLKHPGSNHKSAGFTDDERQKMTELLEIGLVDTFRSLYPEKKDVYTWWSYITKARERNVGWRIDYFLVSQALTVQMQDALVYDSVQGSDHCPVGLLLAESIF